MAIITLGSKRLILAASKAQFLTSIKLNTINLERFYAVAAPGTKGCLII